MNIAGKENGVNYVKKIWGRLGAVCGRQRRGSIGAILSLHSEKTDKNWSWRRWAGLIVAALMAGGGGLAIGAGAMTVATAQDGSRPSIHGFRISHHRNLTRLVLTLDGPIRFRTYTVDKPYRLIVDMQPVNWRLATSLPLEGGTLLQKLSYSSLDGVSDLPLSRVTALMKRAARIQKSFALRPKGKARDWRLVVDLAPVSPDEFDRLKRSRRKSPHVRRHAARPAGKPIQRANAHRQAGQSAAQSRSAGPWVIVLDPGHGGVDKGAISPWGLYEKRVVLSTARLVRDFLNRNPRFKAILTRDADVYIPLRKRYEIARQNRASLFISIHADSNPLTRLRGLSVHTLSSKASDRLAARLAERENRSDAAAGIRFDGTSKSVSNILMDLVQRETRVGSARISRLIVSTARRRIRLLRKPQRSASFVVLKAPDVPSVLVELGFLTNRHDARLLKTRKYRKRLAAILARAIVRYFERHPGEIRRGQFRGLTAKRPAASGDRQSARATGRR